MNNIQCGRTTKLIVTKPSWKKYKRREKWAYQKHTQCCGAGGWVTIKMVGEGMQESEQQTSSKCTLYVCILDFSSVLFFECLVVVFSFVFYFCVVVVWFVLVFLSRRNAVVVNEDNSTRIRNRSSPGRKKEKEKKNTMYIYILRKKNIKSQKCTYKYAKDVSLITLFALASIFTSTLSISVAHVFVFPCQESQSWKHHHHENDNNNNNGSRSSNWEWERVEEKKLSSIFSACVPDPSLPEFCVSHTSSIVQSEEGTQPTTRSDPTLYLSVSLSLSPALVCSTHTHFWYHVQFCILCAATPIFHSHTLCH